MNTLVTGLELLLGPDRRCIVSPDRKTIEDALRAMGQDKDRWATLSWSFCDYVAATLCDAGGFNIEIEFESRDFHNRIKGNPLPLQQVIPIFDAFARKDSKWMDTYVWEQVPLKEIDFRKAPDTLQGKDVFHG